MQSARSKHQACQACTLGGGGLHTICSNCSLLLKLEREHDMVCELLLPLQSLENWRSVKLPPEIGEIAVAVYAPKAGTSAEQGAVLQYSAHDSNLGHISHFAMQ